LFWVNIYYLNGVNTVKFIKYQCIYISPISINININHSAQHLQLDKKRESVFAVLLDPTHEAR